MDNIEDLFDDSISKIDYDKISDKLGLDVKQLENSLINETPKIDIKYSKQLKEYNTPSYAYETDSGFDLYSTSEVEIDGFGRALVPTGLHFDIPDGYEIQVRSKSGLAIKQGLMVLNSPGTVDQGYTGEIKVIIFNFNNEPQTIKKGDKVAQAVICPVAQGKDVELIRVEEIQAKDRNANGFGSTGN